MTRTARIALARPLRRLFDYEVPGSLAVQVGQRVEVPFGPRSATGLVVETDSQPPAGIALKPIRSVHENWPALPPETMTLLSWAATYYQHPLGECLHLALPPALRRGQPARLRQTSWWRARGDAHPRHLPARAHRQRELLTWLTEQPAPRETSAVTSAGFTTAQLQGLQQKGLAETVAAPNPGADDTQPLPVLSPAQQTAYAQLGDMGRFSTTLLYGITGSGKTELYLHYLKDGLQSHQQALVLVPEINLTPQTVARFRRYFGTRIAVWHSALSDGERLATWLRVRHGEPVVVVGTRSAVMLPFTRLAAIVVDEEHDSSYKQGEGFRYSGRDLAIYRARLNHCPIILGSATPSLESYHNARNNKYRLVRLEERAGSAKPPQTRLVDIRSRPLEGGLCSPVLDTIQRTLDAGRQVLVFVNRRGFAPVMMCFDCGHMVECPHCDTRLTYHRRDRAMRCHHCNYQTAASDTCPACQSQAFKPVGQGTERTEDVLAERFASTPVIRVDRDSTQRKGSIQAILATVNSGEPCILVGTQMLAKGHDFHGVTLVVVVNADGGLFSVDFRAPEQLLQTLLQVSGRAGRGDQPGQVLIQTCHSDHPLLQQLANDNYLTIAGQLLQERAAGGMPPHRAMAILRAEAPDMETGLAFLDQAKATMADQPLVIWGPLPAVVARRADRYRAQLVMLCDRRGTLNQVLSGLCEKLDRQRLPRQLRWQIDVDPLETG